MRAVSTELVLQNVAIDTMSRRVDPHRNPAANLSPFRRPAMSRRTTRISPPAPPPLEGRWENRRCLTCSIAMLRRFSGIFPGRQPISPKSRRRRTRATRVGQRFSLQPPPPTPIGPENFSDTGRNSPSSWGTWRGFLRGVGKIHPAGGENRFGHGRRVTGGADGDHEADAGARSYSM